MMYSIHDLIEALKLAYSELKFFNGCISKDEECIGVFARGNASPPTAIGTKPSYGILPVTFLIHWNNNSFECEKVANALYEGLGQHLAETIESIQNTRVIQIQLLDSCPTNIGRDDNNRCEMTIRCNLFYEKGGN